MSDYSDAIGPFQGESGTDLSDLLGFINPRKSPSINLHELFGLNDQGCDVPLAVSMFADVKAQRLEPLRLSLRQIHARLNATSAPAKSDLPLIKLGTFGDVRTVTGNSLRHDSNLLRVSGIEGDYDAGEVSPQEAADRLDRAGIAALIYTTPNHTSEAPRFRVLAPLAREVTREERETLCARLNGALGGILENESFIPSQSFYFGSATTNPVQSFLIEGQPLDRVTGITPIGPQPKPMKSATDLSDLFREPTDRAEVRRALECITDADDRDQWLNIGMSIHSEFNGSAEGFGLWADWSRQSSKFNERDQRRTWKSFKRGGVGIGTLFKIAMDYGYERGPLAQDSDFDDLNGDAPAPLDGAKSSTLTFLTPEECEASEVKPYVIKGLLREMHIGCIFGAPGAGKSLIAPFIGYMLAQGSEAFGMRTKAGGVFYVAAEDSNGMRGRVKALRKVHGGADLFKLVEGVSDLLVKDSPDFSALKQAVKLERPKLIFIDTLAMAFPGLEENSAEGMGRVVAVARALTRWDAAVVLIHHDTKAEGGTPRGHSIFNGALDMSLHVKRDSEQKIIRGKLFKNRAGSPDREIAFTIATDDFGFDEDGDSVTYPRCNPLVGVPKKIKGLAPSRQAALDVLVQAGGRLSEKEYRALAAESRAVSGSDDANSRRTIAGKAISDLIREKRITFADGFYAICDGFAALFQRGHQPERDELPVDILIQEGLRHG